MATSTQSTRFSRGRTFLNYEDLPSALPTSNIVESSSTTVWYLQTKFHVCFTSGPAYENTSRVFAASRARLVRQELRAPPSRPPSQSVRPSSGDVLAPAPTSRIQKTCSLPRRRVTHMASSTVVDPKKLQHIDIITNCFIQFGKKGTRWQNL